MIDAASGDLDVEATAAERARSEQAEPMLDLLIRGGTVIDGTGAPGRAADVAISGGRVVELGRLDGAAAEKVIDASGFVVAPGFVDIHSHGDITVLADPRARSAISQGVTTIVVGNCGHAPAPLAPDHRAALPDLTFGYQAPFDGGLDVVRRVPRRGGCRPAGRQRRRARRAQRAPGRGARPRSAAGDALTSSAAMVAALGRAMDEGAFGVSSGLEYPLGAAATTDELVALATEAGRRGGLYAIHTRDRDFRAVEAFDEAFAIAERSDAAFQISHIAPRVRRAADGAGGRARTDRSSP